MRVSKLYESLTLIHRLPRWINVNPTLILRLASAGVVIHDYEVDDLKSSYCDMFMTRNYP